MDAKTPRTASNPNGAQSGRMARASVKRAALPAGVRNGERQGSGYVFSDSALSSASHNTQKNGIAVSELPWLTPIALLLIFIIGVVLRWHRLDGQSLWIDELGEGTTAQLGLGQLFTQVRADHGATPLDYLGVKLMITLLGHSTLVTRLWSLSVGSLAILMIYLVGSSILKSKLVGLIAALMLALSAFHIYYSQEARFYALLTLTALANLYTFNLALSLRRWKYWCLFGCVVAIGLYTHYFVVVLLIAEAVFVTAMEIAHVVRGKWRRGVVMDALRQIAWTAASMVGGLVLFLPWFFYATVSQAALQSHDSTFGRLPPLHLSQVVQVYVVLLTLGRPAVPTSTDSLREVVLAGTVLGLATLGFATSMVSGRLLALVLAAVAALAVPLAWTADQIGNYFFAERQVIFVLPLMYLLAAAGAGNVIKRLGAWLLGHLANLRTSVGTGQLSSDVHGGGSNERGSGGFPVRSLLAQVWRLPDHLLVQALALSLLVMFSAGWTLLNWASIHQVYAGTWATKEDWRSVAAFIDAHACPTAHYYSWLGAQYSYGFGYYDPRLLAASQYVYNAAGTYQPTLLGAISMAHFQPTDWIVLSSDNGDVINTGPSPDAYLTRQGWLHMNFTGMRVYYRQLQCST